MSDASLLEDTLRRLQPLVLPDRTLVLTSVALLPAVRAITQPLGVPSDNLLGEPRSAGTAAALTWGALEIARRAGRDAVMLCVHADWAVADERGFRQALARAAAVATAHASLVTVGVVPTRPDPGYGYIKPGPEVAAGVLAVARFVEKPDRSRAQQMIAEGYLWNSGIFVWRVGDFLDEVRRHTPEVAPALAATHGAGDSAAFFRAVEPVSVDVGVMERSDRVLVVPGDFGWDDVGTWAALRRVRPTDAHGNAVHGAVHAQDAHDNVVHTEGSTVVLYGVSDLVIVVRDGLTLVTTVDRAADLKSLVATVPSGRAERTS